MAYVYIIKLNDGSYYIGSCRDIIKRLKNHKYKQVYSTSRMGLCDLIYFEAFINEKDAREREKYLKTTQGKRTLKLMLKYTFAPFV